MTLDTNLELISALVQALVIGLLFFRKIYKSLPLFSSYLIWVLVADGAALLVTLYRAQWYERLYLAEAIIDAAFMFCVLVELSMSVLRPIRSSLPRWTFLAVSGLLALAFVAIWPFAKPPGSVDLTSSAVQHIMHLDTASSVLRLVFFLALAGFSQLLSIGWRDRELQIATGLGFYSFAGLAVTLLHMNQGAGTPALNRQYHMLDEVVVGCYICSMLYWVVSFAQKVPERREFTPQMQNFLLALADSARGTRLAMSSAPEYKKTKFKD